MYINDFWSHCYFIMDSFNAKLCLHFTADPRKKKRKEYWSVIFKALFVKFRFLRYCRFMIIGNPCTHYSYDLREHLLFEITFQMQMRKNDLKVITKRPLIDFDQAAQSYKLGKNSALQQTGSLLQTFRYALFSIVINLFSCYIDTVCELNVSLLNFNLKLNVFCVGSRSFDVVHFSKMRTSSF